jgi:hypothetical protein
LSVIIIANISCFLLLLFISYMSCPLLSLLALFSFLSLSSRSSCYPLAM